MTALSLLAKHALFLDTSHQAVKIIKQNLETTGFTNKATVMRGDAFTYLQAPSETGFDLLYVAPPQYKVMWE